MYDIRPGISGEYLVCPLLTLDINECRHYPGRLCAHKCENTEGSYTCSCTTGFKLSHDGRNCEGKITFHWTYVRAKWYTVYTVCTPISHNKAWKLPWALGLDALMCTTQPNTVAKPSKPPAEQCDLPHRKNCSGMPQWMWKGAQGVVLAFKFPRSQSNLALAVHF